MSVPRPVATQHRETTTSASARPGSPDRAWQLVMVREITVKLTDRIFVLSTVGMIALITALLGLQIYLAERTSTFDVVATADAEAMARTVAGAAPGLDEDVRVQVQQVPDEAAARAAVRAEDADAWLHRRDDGWTLTTRAEPAFDLESVARQAIRAEVLRRNAEAAGTTPQAMEAGSQLAADFLEGDAQRAELAAAVGFVFAFLFYLAALLFGMSLASSVVEEKQSRIVEIIATAVPLRQLLAGKVLGNTVLAMGQLALYLAVGMVGLSFTDYSALVPTLSSTVAWFAVFFLAGFAVLACLWAVAGSLADRTEDLQATTGPLTLITMAVFFAALFLEGQWAVAASFVPPLSAVLMPIRLLEQSASWWEATIALAILLAAAAATIRVGERLYRRSLLQTGGGRISLRTAWRAEE